MAGSFVCSSLRLLLSSIYTCADEPPSGKSIARRAANQSEWSCASVQKIEVIVHMLLSESDYIHFKFDLSQEWLNVYNRVEVTLSTHDAGPDGGLSVRDDRLARKMDQLAST